MLGATLLTCLASVSKLGTSKVAGGERSCEPGTLQPPNVKIAGTIVSENPEYQTLTLSDGRTLHLQQLHDELQLTYVHNLLDSDEVDTLVRLADGRDGFTRSPLKAQRSGESATGDDRRNSSSCPMLWPLAYAGRRAAIESASNAAALVEELELVTSVTERVADMFTKTGMEISANYIEPLQLVKYEATETFRPHHDYHEDTSRSSVQGEQRIFTVLIFASTVDVDAGGETHFPLLDVAISPRMGDAIIWANVGADGEPNPRSLHEGRPPAANTRKYAINCWVADKPFSLGDGMDGAVKTK